MACWAIALTSGRLAISLPALVWRRSLDQRQRRPRGAASRAAGANRPSVQDEGRRPGGDRRRRRGLLRRSRRDTAGAVAWNFDLSEEQAERRLAALPAGAVMLVHSPPRKTSTVGLVAQPCVAGSTVLKLSRRVDKVRATGEPVAFLSDQTRPWEQRATGRAACRRLLDSPARSGWPEIRLAAPCASRERRGPVSLVSEPRCRDSGHETA